jgi:tRNA threonylcarbamoyladenosine biosynthesis protein TsaB
MRVLGLDTSTLTTSVAIAIDGKVVASVDVATVLHSDILMHAIDTLVQTARLTPRGLDAVAVGVGPGSFTGLRIGMATAKGIAFAAGKPLYLVSSLAALAWDAATALAREPALAAGVLVPVLDARKGELYAGFYRRDGATVRAVAAERVIAPGELAAAIDAARGGGAAAVFGDALAVHALAFAAPVDARPELRQTPSGAAVALLASHGDLPDALDHGAPRYIRPAEAEVKYPDGVPGALRKR